MNAKYDGSVITITLDSQAEKLAARGTNHYLPCSQNCGALCEAADNVVSTMCDACWKNSAEE